MPRYRYTGMDATGRPVTGERDAPDPDALLAALGGEVPQVRSVQVIGMDLPGPADTAAGAGIRRGDEREISGHIAELIEAQLPLESGLAAIAAECPSRRMRSTLRGIAADLAAGNDLETALSGRGAPEELKALVRAGARSGNTGQILEHYVVNVQSSAELRQVILRGMLYPLILLVASCVLGSFALVWIVPQFVSMFEGFSLQLPLLTVWLVAASKFYTQHAATVALAGLALTAAVIVLGRLLLGEANCRRLVGQIPVFGSILRWISLARFSQLLSLLVENRVPLDEALRLAGDAARDAEIQDDCRRMLAGVAAGESLESAARKLNRFPSSFVQALTWAERAHGMPEVLQSLGDMYAGRVRTIVAVLVAVVPPILMLFIGLAASFLVGALFLPLLQLLNALA
jgi:type IV pilus assembly protein PilC